MTARRWLINMTVMAGIVAGGFSIQVLAATNALPTDSRDDPVTSPGTQPLGITPMAPGSETTLQPSGNPLWGVPLRNLSATRDRPIFTPSRRPPAPPAVVATYTEPAKTKAPEPDRPALSLVGTVSGTSEGFAVFTNDATRETVRLRTGEGFEGWILLSVQVRQAVLEKNRKTAVFELPLPSGDKK